MEPAKGYRAELTRTWWLKHGFFKQYMLREATVLPLVFFLGAMLAGIYSLHSVPQLEAWQAFMAQPVVIFLNVWALIAALYHAFTFFQLFPRVMPIRIGDKLVPASLMIMAQWIAVVAVAVGFIGLFMGFGSAQ